PFGVGSAGSIDILLRLAFLNRRLLPPAAAMQNVSTPPRESVMIVMYGDCAARHLRSVEARQGSAD
ncbi:hypothetical protein, partial [uncultured Novosphingobium sp.]|uniref:hypothetical protein n=1 Tax=uncultured Novosphingobium sp. TaxID=292277 RepID=UPI0025927A71